MRIIQKLKHAFLLASGTFILSGSALSPEQNNLRASRDNFNQVARTPISPASQNIFTASTKQQEQTARLDYAFGDQVAMHSGLPGRYGENWGPSDVYRALRDFNDEHPGELRGKNIMITICDGTLVGTLIYIPKITKLIDRIMPANVIVMGISETRTDIDGADANRRLKEYVEEKGAVYGGPMPGGASKENIYPVTQASFARAVEQAQNALTTRVQKTRSPAAAPASPRPAH